MANIFSRSEKYVAGDLKKSSLSNNTKMFKRMFANISQTISIEDMCEVRKKVIEFDFYRVVLEYNVRGYFIAHISSKMVWGRLGYNWKIVSRSAVPYR